MTTTITITITITIITMSRKSMVCFPAHFAMCRGNTRSYTSFQKSNIQTQLFLGHEVKESVSETFILFSPWS